MRDYVIMLISLEDWISLLIIIHDLLNIPVSSQDSIIDTIISIFFQVKILSP